MASGFMNMLSFWMFFVSCIIMLSSLFVESGPASAGWTIYPPLSALPQAIPGSGLGMTLWLVSMAIFIASSLMGSLNYVVTVINLRTKGMTMTRLPLTVWAFFVTAIIGIVSFPVLFSAALLLIFDRSFGTSFFLSDIFIQGEVLHYQGGSPVLFEHLFCLHTPHPACLSLNPAHAVPQPACASRVCRAGPGLEEANAALRAERDGLAEAHARIACDAAELQVPPRRPSPGPAYKVACIDASSPAPAVASTECAGQAALRVGESLRPCSWNRRRACLEDAGRTR